MLFCLLFGRGRVIVFAVWVRGVCFLVFAVWAGGVSFLLLFGRGAGVHSLTGLPGPSSSDPTRKKTKQQKKQHGFRTRVWGWLGASSSPGTGIPQRIPLFKSSVPVGPLPST